jgi:hypothetical protein
MVATKVSRSKWKEKQCGIAIKQELTQLFKELQALRVIRRAEVNMSANVLKSHMFLVCKYLANGVFEKVKARLVSDGQDQDVNLYLDKSLPMVALQSVFTVLGLGAMKTWRKIIKIDLKGAFVQTPMKGQPTYMKLDPKITKYAVELYTEYSNYVEGDGCLYTVMLKVMYGCVPASALWCEKIWSELEKLQYEVGKTDLCVFAKQVGERIFIL